MTLQNRVTPFGEVIAIPQRGMFTGNRGIIHDPATKTLLSRRWATKAWIVCSRDYKGVHRDPMATQSWTELFFLDEAVALAAGHRPCFLCRRPAAQAFTTAWGKATGAEGPPAGEIDAILHRERLNGRAKRIHPYCAAIEDLPDGAAFTAAGESFVVAAGRPFRWTAAGYRMATGRCELTGLLTPPSTLAALRAGYLPSLHPTCRP